MTIQYHSGVALAKKKGKDIHIVETPTGIGDMLPVAAAGTVYPRQLRYRFADVVNVKDFGAVGDGHHDDTAAIQAAIVQSTDRHVACYMPSGVYLISSDIALPSDSFVYGDGEKKTIFVVAKTAKNELDGFVNLSRYKAKYQSVAQTTYDTDITIKNLAIKMNGWDRAAQVTDSYGGCGVKLAGVKGALVENVTVIDAVMHGFDCSTFELKNNHDVGHFNYDAVSGGCEQIVFRDTKTINSVIDDGLTTHFAKNVLVDGHKSIFNRSVKAKENQNGIEFDGGSENCTATSCYVYGYASAYSAVGHHQEPPARNITVTASTAEKVANGCVAWCVPTEVPQTELAEKTCARNVIFTDITLRDLSASYEGATKLRPVKVEGYANVVVDGLQTYGICSENVAKVQCVLNGFFGVYRNLAFRDISYVSGTSEYYGLFTTQVSDFASSKHNIVENVFVDNLEGYTYALFDKAGSIDKIANFIVEKQSGLAAGIISNNERVVLENIDIVGLKNKVLVTSSETSTGQLRDFVATNVSACESDFAQNATSTFVGVNRPHFRFGNAYSKSGHISYPINTQFFIGEWDGSTFTARVLLSAEKSLNPGLSNAQALGSATARWSQLFAATGTINTSDERSKTSIDSPDDALMRAWSKVNFKVFQFKDAVEKKGGDARIHVGVVAQEVKAAFESEGLDATRYGLLCYDKWDDEYEDVEVVDTPEVVAEDGTVTPAQTHVVHRLVTPAGDRYGIRYEEALALEAAYQRWRLAQIEARL
ncbi:glycosyl hydrolase family 28-related protein [Duodenibacillus massiliensis]|jgi:hypothetical protein|uniref:glycosyl hydrolase family 28-related protein n=1 Tax=Duodenibacillus massiliensis TaxID=1852381 RepID=UPI0009393082|nr:glycosyl hydrolase family 28-related protein [Duodenibacillus massiliensis]